MVPSKRIAPETPPETLPEDFSDWEEGSSSSATVPVELKEFEARNVAPPQRERAPMQVAPTPAPRTEPAPRHVDPAPRHVEPAPRHVDPAPRAADPAPRHAEKSKSASSRAQSGADSDLEAFLRRLSEVNAEQAPVRHPEPNGTTNLWSPAAPAQPAAPVRKEPAPAPVKAAPVEAAPVERESAPMFRTGYDLGEDSEDGSKKGPRWGLIGAISAGVVAVALAITIPMVLRGRSVNAPRPTTTQLQVPEPQEGTSALKPSPDGTTSATVNSAAGQQPKTGTQPAAANENATVAANQAPVSADLMNQQLTAASQLPKGARKGVSEDAPPPSGFSTAGMDGASDTSAVGNAFRNETKLKLVPVTVSAGVAGGLLIRKVNPVFPSIAKTARVSGKVVLAATISKSGFVTNLQVVSGPPMLRQAAMDAVKNWVYKPYLLNNQPTEVQTTVSVDFSLE
jgi:TonB family protein